MLPDFDGSGLLPPGDYPLTLPDLRMSLLVCGGLKTSPSWDADWRAQLVDNLEVLVGQLHQARARGMVGRIFIDGSFVEEKDHPNDIDGYFECDLRAFASGALEQVLNSLDPDQVWTWDPGRRLFEPHSGKRQLPMWHRYRVELYPHVPGLLAGIQDRYGNEQEFPSAFRQQRGTFLPKGIVEIVE